MAIQLFGAAEIDALRAAGEAAAATLAYVGARLEVGMSTADIDTLVREDTKRRGGRCSQLGYQGFPRTVCTSINEVVCHGIPSDDVILREGDIVNVDVTTEIDGFHGDNSRTYAIGKVSSAAAHVVDVAERSLVVGIAAVRAGGRLGDIGAAIQSLAESEGCSVVREYCGHGIGREMHAEPSVPHYGRAGRGLRLREGMVFTIEPMVNLGEPDVVLLDDGWTVVTKDGSLSAQFEHTIYVGPDGPEVLTAARAAST